MAEIPRIWNEARIARLELNRAGAGAGAVAAGLGRAADVFGAITEASDEAESRRLQAETAAKIRDALVMTKQEEMDPTVYQSFASGRVEEIKRQALKSATSSRVRSRLDDFLSPIIIRSQTEINATTREKQIANALGNSTLYLEQSKRDIARMDDPLERQRKEQEIKDHLEKMVSVGAYTPKQAGMIAERMLHDIDEEKAFIGIESGTLKPEDVTAERFPFLDAKERVSVKSRVETALREQERKRKEAEQEAMDEANKEILGMTEAAGANLSKLREDILKRKDLPFQVQKFWVDRLNARIKALEKGEEDPFLKSDSATLGRVFKTILENPNSISPSQISALIGRGLSVSDALRATALHDSRLKAQQGPAFPAAMDPLNMTFKNWERLRESMAFVPEGERVRNDPDAQIKNDSRATEVWQAVLDRIQQNPQANPQAVFNELMQPFYEEKVEGFFSRLYGAVTSPFREAPPSREERIAARQQLARRGIEITEENIQAVIQRKTAARAKPGAAKPVIEY